MLNAKFCEIFNENALRLLSMAVYCSSYAKIYRNNIIVVECFLWNEVLK